MVKEITSVMEAGEFEGCYYSKYLREAVHYSTKNDIKNTQTFRPTFWRITQKLAK